MNAKLKLIDIKYRYRIMMAFIAILVVLIFFQLVNLQIVKSASYVAQLAKQRISEDPIYAKRGSIYDKNGVVLAQSIEERSLTFQPKIIQQKLLEANGGNTQNVAQYFSEIASYIANKFPDRVRSEDLYNKLVSGDTFTYLIKNIEVDQAKDITSKYPEVGAERVNFRNYPNGSVGANIIGSTNSEQKGLDGLEESMDSVLSGRDGRRIYDSGPDGVEIPGSEHLLQKVVNGKDIYLTLEADLQMYVQQELQKAKSLSGAKRVAAVVLDARDSSILAMVNDDVFNPANKVDDNGIRSNFSVTSPFEPGSVQKIVAASAAIEKGVTTQNELFAVPDSITMTNITVHDAWPHGVIHLTTNGIIGKSSNVGTLMLAQRIGPEYYAKMLEKFGLGKGTNSGLPGESAGDVPALSQWVSGTFANLPIGQGLSMTLLQMTGMYQTIANGGYRIPPHILKNAPVQTGVQVVSPQTAGIVADILRATIQDDTGMQRGTGPAAAVVGYQISGKTGTAQQLDPNCNCYSESKYNITFAGFAPTNNPRYVIGIYMDAPIRGSDGSGGQSAAPLFHNIMSWLLAKNNVPPSPPAPKLLLEKD